MTDETVHIHKRVSDDELSALITKVSILDQEVKDLRREFDNQVVINDKSHRSLGQNFQLVQQKVDQIMVELKTHTAIEESRIAVYNKEISDIKVAIQKISDHMTDYHSLVEKVFSALDELRKEVLTIKSSTEEPIKAYSSAKNVYNFFKWAMEAGKILFWLGAGSGGAIWMLHSLKLLN